MPQDFERRDYIPDSGWPLKYLGPRALVPQGVPDARDRGVRVGRRRAIGADVEAAVAGLVEHRAAVYQFSPPTRFSCVYGPELERAEDVRVVTFANLVDIRLDQTRGRVEAFACRTLAGTTFQVNAGRYVLALGGVENARVLLASRSQQREGVANGHDVVGRYFMEHPHYYGSIGVVHASALDLSFYRRGDSDWKRADGTPVQMLGALALLPRSHGARSCSISRPRSWRRRAPTRERPRATRCRRRRRRRS